MTQDNNENNKLQQVITPKIKKVGIAARMDAAKASGAAAANADPLTVTNRIGVIFDDSGSMQGKRISDAKDAISGFLRVCNPGNTSIALYPLNKGGQTLVCNMMQVQMFVMGIQATGGTPLYETLDNMLEKEPITRAVVFSDGEPNRSWNYETSGLADRETTTVEKYKSKEVQIDTVYIGLYPTDRGADVLKSLAEKTGGIFLHFTDTSVFAKNMKFLAPAHRHMLANAELKDKIQRGEM